MGAGGERLWRLYARPRRLSRQHYDSLGTTPAIQAVIASENQQCSR